MGVNAGVVPAIRVNVLLFFLSNSHTLCTRTSLEAQTEVEELRKEIEGLREKVQEAEKVKELSSMLQESHR